MNPCQSRIRRSPTATILGFFILAHLAGGCAYFNTFYHAKKYYSDGERTQNQALASGHPSAATMGAESYRKCIEKCKKVVTNHPNSKWVDDAQIQNRLAQSGRAHSADHDDSCAWKVTKKKNLSLAVSSSQPGQSSLESFMRSDDSLRFYWGRGHSQHKE